MTAARVTSLSRICTYTYTGTVLSVLGILDNVDISRGRASLNLNFALSAGSSKHGIHLLASVGWNCVAATHLFNETKTKINKSWRFSCSYRFCGKLSAAGWLISYDSTKWEDFQWKFNNFNRVCPIFLERICISIEVQKLNKTIALQIEQSQSTVGSYSSKSQNSR